MRLLYRPAAINDIESTADYIEGTQKSFRSSKTENESGQKYRTVERQSRIRDEAIR